MKPNQLYRPNIDRSIEVFGGIDEGLVSRLAPKILSLRAKESERLNDGSLKGAEPITVYINSTGGELRCLQYLYDLIKSPSPDGFSPQLITVGVGTVGSAAAAFLGLGDYSIAYPGALIYFHGARYTDVSEITVESASRLATQLQATNQEMASKLARKSCERLAFKYWVFKEATAAESPQAQNQPKPLTWLSPFEDLMREQLSAAGVKILDRAQHRCKLLREISNHVKKDFPTTASGIEFEAEMLRRIIDFEAGKHKDKGVWNVSQILADFFLLKEYDTGSHHDFFDRLVERFGDAFFTPQEALLLRDNKEDPNVQKIFNAKVNETLLPFCYFAASICLVLHQQENPMSAEDAYWLGEVDEVYGLADLPCMRVLEEAETPATAQA